MRTQGERLMASLASNGHARSWAAAGRILAGLAGAALLAVPAAAQRRATGPDLNELALDWARGQYASPVLCEFDGEVRRGVRRVSITPGPRHARPPVDRVLFIDMEIDGASRCFDALGETIHNLVGAIEIRLPGSYRTDTARHDFSVALRRHRGFAFSVPSGRLKLSKRGAAATERIEFRGGRVRLNELDPASDSARLLSDFSSPRKLMLELTTKDGARYRIPLFLIAER